MPSPLIAVRVSDPELYEKFLATVETDFKGSKTDLVIAALTAFLSPNGSRSGFVTLAETTPKRPRKTTVRKKEPKLRQPNDSRPTMVRVLTGGIPQMLDLEERADIYPGFASCPPHDRTGKFNHKKEWFCRRCGEAT